MAKEYVAVSFAPIDQFPLRYMKVGEDFMEVLGLDEEERYLPERYENVFSVDSDWIFVVADSLHFATTTAILAMLDHLRGRYDDGVSSEYEDMQVDYATWLTPYIQIMAEIAFQPEETLEEWIKNH